MAGEQFGKPRPPHGLKLLAVIGVLFGPDIDMLTERRRRLRKNLREWQTSIEAGGKDVPKVKRPAPSLRPRYGRRTDQYTARQPAE
jgi:hypothetical protein